MSQVIATIRKGQKGKPPTVEFKTEGVPGGDCRIASEPYESAVGSTVVSDRTTEEMDLPPVVGNTDTVTA